MKLGDILAWIDGVLEPQRFDDVSNNGLQIDREGDEVSKVAFAVDGSAASVKAAADAGAELLVVHHGISWGGGIRRLAGGEFRVVKGALAADLALAGYHLPLDANREVGNNWEIARALGLENVSPAFSYHGNVIGVTGVLTDPSRITAVFPQLAKGPALPPSGSLLGVCSGGAGEFAADAKALGCAAYLTGEASWGDVIAAENAGMPMFLAGHYETETFGVKALMAAMKKALGLATVFVSLALVFAPTLHASPSTSTSTSTSTSLSLSPYIGAAGTLTLPQGGSRLRRLGGGAVRGGCYLTEACALEGEAAWLEDRCGLVVRGLFHWKGWDEWDMLFGYSRFDPFFTLGVETRFPDGQSGPAAGFGTLWYLTDEWALRFDAGLCLGVDTRCEAVYSLSAGVQYSW